jgi:hypothetical protein
MKKLINGWHFLTSWNQIKSFHEIYVCDRVIQQWKKQFFQSLINISLCKRITHKQKMFWFRNMQEVTGVVDRHMIRHICSILIKSADRCLLKWFFGYWNNHYEVVHGLSRTEMHQLFERHIKKRTYRRSILLWRNYVSRQNLPIHAVQICVNMHKIAILDQMISYWWFVSSKSLSSKVVKFMHSLQMTLRTKLFFMWREASYQQKIMNRKGKFLAWRPVVVAK